MLTLVTIFNYFFVLDPWKWISWITVYAFLLPSKSFCTHITSPRGKLSKNVDLKLFDFPTQILPMFPVAHGEKWSPDILTGQAWLSSIWPPFHLGLLCSTHFTCSHSGLHVGASHLLVEFLLYWPRSWQEARGILDLDDLMSVGFRDYLVRGE